MAIQDRRPRDGPAYSRRNFHIHTFRRWLLIQTRLAVAKLIWKFDTHGGAVVRDLPGLKSETYDYLASAPTISDGVVYIGSADRKLYALDASTGNKNGSSRRAVWFDRLQRLPEARFFWQL